MKTIDAINEVNHLLGTGDIAKAQEVAVELREVLPSSVFERVLKAAVAKNEHTAEYVTFCSERFGKTVLANMVWEAVA